MMPYHYNGNHWILLIYSVDIQKIIIFDSSPSNHEEYRETVLVFLYICRQSFNFRNIPSLSVVRRVSPPKEFYGTWTFPEQKSSNNSKYRKSYKVNEKWWNQNNNYDCGPFVVLNFLYFFSAQSSNALFDHLFNDDAFVLPMIPPNFMLEFVRKTMFFALFVLEKREVDAADRSFN